MFEAWNQEVPLHEIPPVIDRFFPFESVKEALHQMERRKHFG